MNVSGEAMSSDGKESSKQEAGRSTFWTVFLALFLWFGVSIAAFKVFLIINPILGALALAFLLVKKLRDHLPQSFSSKTRLFGMLGLAVIGFGAARSAKSSAIEKEQEAASERRIEAAEDDRKIRSVEKRLNELAAMADTKPVEVYRELASVLPHRLKRHAEAGRLQKVIDELKAKTAKPYAAHRFEEAGDLMKEKELAKAQSAVREAIRLDPALSGSKDLSERIASAIALDTAKKSATSLRTTSADTMKTAKKLMTNKQFLAASIMVKEHLGYLAEHEQRHGKLVSLIGLEKRLQKLHGSLIPKVEKQKVREAKEREERTELLDYCGKPPKRNDSDGIDDVASFVRQTAHDPDSIEVSDCSVFILDERKCWVTTCNVRGKNAFGAKILNRQTFSLERDENDSSRYIVRVQGS